MPDAPFCTRPPRASLSTAAEKGLFDGQIVPVEVRQKKETVQVARDEHVRPGASEERFAELRPVFEEDGTATARNSSGINDGAAMMLVISSGRASDPGLPVAGRLLSSAVAGVDPGIMGTGMIPASRAALKKAGLSVEDLNHIEANEANACHRREEPRSRRVPRGWSDACSTQPAGVESP